jgi:hypothetical protein
MSFAPANELEALIYDGDGDAVLEMLAAMPESQRLAQAGRLGEVADLMRYWWYDRYTVHDSWGMRATDGQRDAIEVAMLVCAPADRAASFRLQAERLVAVAERFRPPSLPLLAQALWECSHPAAALQLARAGLSPLELDDEALLRLMAIKHRLRLKLRDYLAANIETLKPVLLKVFELEGTGDVNLAAIDKYTFQDEETWAWNLLRLCEDGVYARTEMLARCLDTLERDWPQFRAGWFSRFHDRLAPTVEEMEAESARYLSLLHSRIPPTVTMALGACARLLDMQLLDAVSLLDALRPVMLSSVKAQINSALKLLDTVVMREPGQRTAAARLALEALQHTDPGLQQSIVKRLGKWGLDDDGTAAAQAMWPFVAPNVQPALAALGGGPSARQQDDWRDISLPPPAQPVSPLDPSRTLTAPATLDELVSLCARLLEDESDLDMFETAFGALLAAAPFSGDDRARFAPVLKRARKLKVDRWDLKACVSGEFARLLLSQVADEERERLPAAGGALGLLSERIDDASAFDIATHRGGFIDPALLVQRAGKLGAQLADLPLRVQVRALLRLAPVADAGILRAAQALPGSPFQQALCYALGGEWPSQPNEALCLAAARIRHPGEDDPAALLVFGGELPDGAGTASVELDAELVEWEHGSYHSPRSVVRPVPQQVDTTLLAPHMYMDFWRHSEALILFGASHFPSSHEAMYGDAMPGLAQNLQYPDTEWHQVAWLRVLGEPVTAMTPPAVKTLALALMGKDPGRLARAVDAFVASGSDGRLDAHALGRALLGLQPHGFFMAGRLAAALATAAAAGPRMPHVVLAVLGVLCESASGETPRDMAKLLQLMQELVLRHRLRPAPAARAALERMPLTGKAQSLRRTLLEALA